MALTTSLMCWPLVVLAQWTAQPNPAQQWTQSKSTKPGEPCCNITNIDSATGVVTGKVNATGKTFRFKVKQQRTLASLKVGLPVSFGKPGGSSRGAPDILDPTSIDEGSQLYINGVYAGEVTGVYGGIYGSGPSDPGGPGPGGRAPGCTACRNGLVQELLACRNSANQTYQQGSPQWTSAMQSCQQAYSNAVTQCGCDGSGSGGGTSACTSCTNNALQQLTGCVRAANQQFQQHKDAAAAARLRSDLDVCNTNYEKAINACPCH